MRIPANAYLIALLLASPISIAWAADEASAPVASPVVGTAPLPEEIEEAQRLATVAEDLRKQGRFAEAEKTYKDALDRNASRTGPWGGLAQTYMDMGQFDKAAGTYELWLKVAPENATAKAGLEKARISQTALATPQKPASSLPADIVLAADRLSFRIMAQQKDFTPADVNALLHDPSATPRNGEFIWLDANSPNFHDSIRNARGAMLAYNKPPKVMLPDGSWGITAAWPDKDFNKRPCLMVKFDKKGAKAFSKLTADNIGRPLAIVIDGHIVSSPFIQSEINSAIIGGDFTDDKVMKMLHALLSKTPIEVESRVFTGSAETSKAMSEFLHDTLAIKSVEPGKPLTWVILSDEQGRKLQTWITSTQTIKLVAAPNASVPNGERTEMNITSKDPNNPMALPGDMKLAVLPYLLKGNRIKMNFAIDARASAGAGGATNVISIDTTLLLRSGENVLIPLQPNHYFLLKAGIAEPAKAKPTK